MSSAAPPNMPSSSSSASKRDCIFDELLVFGSVCVYKTNTINTSSGFMLLLVFFYIKMIQNASKQHES